MTNQDGGMERVKSFQLVGASLRLMRPRLAALMPLAVGTWLLSLGWMHFSLGREAELGFGRELVASLVGAVTGALMVRLMLRPERGWWRPDGGLLGYAALTTVVALPLMSLMTRAGAMDAQATPSPVIFAHLLVALATLYLSAKLVLWFVGVLLGEWCPPAESWRRTKGAALAFILANLWMSIPPMMGMVLVAGSDPTAAADPASTVAMVAQLFVVIAEVLAASVTAAVWTVRGRA